MCWFTSSKNTELGELLTLGPVALVIGGGLAGDGGLVEWCMLMGLVELLLCRR